MKTWPVMSQFPVSENVARMQSSATMAAMQAAEALRASGAKVCDFGAGEPDFDTPDNIKQAADRAMRAGRTKYTANGGIREIHCAIIDFYQKEFGTDYQSSEVMATAGGKQAIFNAVVTLLNPGDEALIPKPYWVTFPEIAVFAGAKPIFIETEDTNFVLTAEQVERAITPRTRLLILNSPSNPSGRVLPPAEFRRIMELTAEHGIYVPALRLSAGPGFQRCEFAGGTARAFVHRGIVFEDLCDDWLAPWLCTRAGRLDQGHAQSSGPFNVKCKLNRAMGGS